MDASQAKQQYEIQGREVIAEATGLRVQVLTLVGDQCVPWHHHSRITDSFFCLSGELLVETRAPEARHRLTPGERCAVPPGQPHRVSAEGGMKCSFLIVQGVGEYDYLPD